MHKVLIFSMIMFGSWLFSVSVASAQEALPKVIKSGYVKLVSGSSSNTSLSTTGTNRLLVVSTYQYLNENVSTITYGGVALTLLKKNSFVYSNDTNNFSLYYLFNPPTATSTLAITYSGASSQKSINYAFYSNVQAVTPSYGYLIQAQTPTLTYNFPSPHLYPLTILAVGGQGSKLTSITSAQIRSNQNSIPYTTLSDNINFTSSGSNNYINTTYNPTTQPFTSIYAIFAPSSFIAPTPVFLASASTTNALYSLGTQFYNYSSVWIYVLGLVFLLVLLWFIGRKLWRLYSVRSIK